MVKTGKWIARHRKLILFLSILLLLPSVIGIAKTRINYDVLSYLPKDLETVEGQDILLDEFGMGGFSMIVVENMELKDVAALKEEISQADHVKDVLWYDSVADISVPVTMLPENLREGFFKGDATMMIALFDTSTSSDEAMDTITSLRKTVGEKCFISGMSAVITDVKNLSLKEMPIYVMIAAVLSLAVLLAAMDSLVVPVLFLLSIGAAILYNLGSNVFLGEISYVTMALTAVLQLGVTMDYSIFLLNSYEENKLRFPGEKDRAMAHAISNTFKSVVGSSVTTIAGFIALCFMTFTLGKDIGIVMAKGVVIGVICCVTLLPSMILTFDRAIEKTKHKSIIPNLDKISGFISRHYKLWLVLFLVLLAPAIYGNRHTPVYYNIDQTLPKTLPGNAANTKLEEDFDMGTVHMVLLKNGLDKKEKAALLAQIDKVDGVNWCLGMDSLVGPAFPDSMVPRDIRNMLKSDHYELQFICSKYRAATDEMNAQIEEIEKIVKSYSPDSMVIGEAPLTKDLVDITDVDFKNVNAISIAAIFVIIMIVFKSLSLPVILVAVIEFAICINMAVPYFQHIELPFVAGIVVGTIQLGATVDYAILMTTRYQKERQKGMGKKESIAIAHKSSMKSVIISGCSFFAATFGVGLYSQVDMIGAICTLLSRGAVISTFVVLLVLPAMFMIFDPIICRTSMGFLPKKSRANQ